MVAAHFKTYDASIRSRDTLAFGWKTMGLAVLLSAALVQAADAHGPTRQKVIETVTISATPDKVWKVMGNFQDMSWLPGVKSTTGTGGNSIDPKNDDNEVAKRTLTLESGGVIQEGLYKYDPVEHIYSYRIDKVDPKVLPVNDYSSTIKVEPSEDGKGSTVTWKGAFYRGYMNNDPPPDMDDAASKGAVKKIYRAGLDNLKKKVEAGS
jgi:hypothetical protein